MPDGRAWLVAATIFGMIGGSAVAQTAPEPGRGDRIRIPASSPGATVLPPNNTDGDAIARRTFRGGTQRPTFNTPAAVAINPTTGPFAR